MKVTKTFVNKLVKNPLDVLQGLSQVDIISLLQQANYAYYNEGAPLFSDEIYDIIKEELKKINPSAKILKHVGAVIDSDDKRKESLPYYMGSMDKIKSDNHALNSFKKKFVNSDFIIGDKLDGNSALLYYKSGVFKLFSRGDGVTGQNISHLIPFINGIPAIQNLKNFKEFTVRGELILSKASFELLQAKGANARNMVAGLVNAKMPDLDIASHVNFVSYALLYPHLNVQAQYKLLKELNFHVVNHTILSHEDLTFETLSDILVQRRSESQFEIDGLIVCDDKFHKVEKDKNPSYAFAFKNVITQETAEVTVKHVEWTVSKDGYFKPVVVFDPVKLSGVTIQRATGFNGEFIKINVIGPGARILITRSGEVIPYIIKSLSPAASGEPQFPNEEYDWTDSGKDIVLNGESRDLEYKRLENFMLKIDIPGVKEGTIKKIYAAGFTTIIKVLKMTQSDIDAITGLKNKSTFLETFKSKLNSIDCITLMIASNSLGRGFGSKRLETILTKFPKIKDGKYVPSMDELLSVEGVSNVTANNFLIGLTKYREFVKQVNLSCDNKDNNTKTATKTKITSKSSTKIKGQVVLFTGFRNKEWEEIIKDSEGDVALSMTKKVTLLVAADTSDTSSKLEKARQQGIKIISKEEFSKWLNL